MTQREEARAVLIKMGRYIKRHGFTPDYELGFGSKCGCFLHASAAVGITGGSWAAMEVLRELTGSQNLGLMSLLACGWDNSATNDAAAACEIAADLLA
jgi:hypothetical protein